MNRTGIINDPLDLSTALSSLLIQPGHTLYLRGGTYTGNFINSLIGTSDNPITIRNYPGERPIINGAMKIAGGHTTWSGIEFAYSDWQSRETLESGSDPSDIPTDINLDIWGPGHKIINCIIRDLAGFGAMTGAVGTEINGCILYSIGWKGPDRGHGHGIYAQNTTGTKLIKNCIIFNNFGWGLHAYTEGGAIDNIQAVGNTCFKNGAAGGAQYTNLMGGLVVANYPVVDSCMTYGDTIQMGYTAGVDHATLTNNYSPAGINKGGQPQNYDAESGNIVGVVGDVVFVIPNDYLPTRANVTIYNEAGANGVTVDLTAVTGLSIGDTVTAWNVQAGVGNDLQTLTLDANKCISVDMQAANRSVAAPIGWTAPATTFPVFGCFVVIKA